jgi:DNA invertase Pin-like site-specific DNA recombinase
MADPISTAGSRLRVALWAAVSSKEQAADDKASIPDQLAAGERFAQAIGAQVVARYVVPGHTRDLVLWTEAETDMPAYRQYREDVQAGRIDVLHVVDEDRLGRDPALSAQVISLLEKRGGEVYAADTPHTIGSKTISHRYISAIKGVRAAEDNSLRQYRFRSGMRSRILKRQLHPGSWPMGYQATRDETGKVIGAEPSPLKDAVLMITALFLAGHSYREIVRRMNAGPYRPPTAPGWSVQAVRGACLNDCYGGLVHWGSVCTAEPSQSFPAFWNPATFAAVIRERQRRAAGPYNRSGGGPYNGVALCAVCTQRLYRHEVRGHHYMRCSTHRLDPAECHANNIPEHRITTALSEALAARTNTAVLDATLALIGGGDAERAARDDLATAQAHAADLEAQRLRLAHTLAAGLMQPDIYFATDGNLAQQLGAERQRILDLSHALDSLPDVDAKRTSLVWLTHNFAAAVARLEPGHMATILQNASVQVYVSQGKVTRISIG